MENVVKIAYVFLCVWALMTFWPLVVLLLSGLAVFLVYTSWKTKRVMKKMESAEFDSQLNKKWKNTDIIEAEYTEKEIEDDKA